MKNVLKILLTTVSVIAFILCGFAMYSAYTVHNFSDLRGIKSISPDALTEANTNSESDIQIHSFETLKEISPYIYGAS